MNLVKFPKRGYIQSPTPIEHLKNFSRALGGQVEIYIKRDDLLPGCEGGNKTRKLDFQIAAALANEVQALITCGAVQSNHCRLTLAWAIKEGLECHLVLEERVKNSYNPRASGNNFLFHLLGVTSLKVVPGGSDMNLEMEKVASELGQKGKKAAIIPGGGADALGALGYVACAEEINAQLFEKGLDISTIFCASGSAGTQAGLVAGLFGTHTPIDVIGINVRRPKLPQTEVVLKLARDTAKLLELPEELPSTLVTCLDEYLGPGYSLLTEETIEAVKLLARTEAILVDPVYTGKTLAGLIDLVKKGHFPPHSRILFLHTGGSPALYSYLESFF